MNMNMYGNSMYGNNMYGGNSLYGNSLYGNNMSMYNSGYGLSGLGGYNSMGNLYNPSPVNGYSPMLFMQNSVNNVGRFSMLLQTASQTLHMTFSSLVQFIGNMVYLTSECGSFIGTLSIFRLLRYLFRKIKHLFLTIIGKKHLIQQNDFENIFHSIATSTNTAATTTTTNGNNTQDSTNTSSWFSVSLSIIGLLYLCQWVYKSVKHDINLQQQQHQLQLQLQQQQPQPLQSLPQSYNNNNPFYQQQQQQQLMEKSWMGSLSQPSNNSSSNNNNISTSNSLSV